MSQANVADWRNIGLAPGRWTTELPAARVFNIAQFGDVFPF